MSTAASIIPGLIGFAVLIALLAIAPRVRWREWRDFARWSWRRSHEHSRKRPQVMHDPPKNQAIKCYCRGFPYPDLSRLAEMDGYMQELAHETGDDSPLQFWREIRRSINAPIRERIRQVTMDSQERGDK